jgi:kinetochore protein Spc7/SPC105
VVREIETETMEENPALFREYIYATPDVRMLMDNQFKNVKTHARLLSKAMWYEWRMKLLDGLKAGLDKTRDGLLNDEELLQQQQHLLDSVLPPLLNNFENLSIEEADLQAAAADLANCDQEELDDARHRLVSLDADVESKKQVIRNLRAQMKENEIRMQKASTTKESYLDDIRASEKIREECRGWTGTEILALKGL